MGKKLEKNTSDRSSVAMLPTMETLRHAFARCCKICGLDQNTCLAMTLLLNTRECLMSMLWAMQEAEIRGVDLDTTAVVNIAVKIKELEKIKNKMEKSKSKNSALKFFKDVKMKPFQYSQEYHDLAMKDIELQSDRDRWKRPSIWSEYDSKKQSDGDESIDHTTEEAEV